MNAASPVNILLVDDQPAKLLSYEVILESLGEQLIKVSSGRDALETLLRNEIAVVLIDVSMPELDGFELAAMIREHPRFERTAIIFVSAIRLSEFDRLRGYAAGAVDYVPVPVEPDLLRAKVRIFADLYRKTRQLELLNAELEQRVAERTAQLEQANAELELRVEARTREREAALAKVAEMQKLESLGQLTGGLAHEFNNLLMIILNNLQRLHSAIGSQPGAASALQRATYAAETGATLTKRMLAFARRQDLRPETVAVKAVVEGMVEMMRHALDPTIHIVSDIATDAPPISIDRNQLELALLNLGLNARDAMPGGGTLTITAGKVAPPEAPPELPPGAYVLLEVSDTGTGMDAATLARASEPFFTTKDVGKGSGLGLSMVYGLVAQSGGLMRISSIEGKGTSIRIWLPAAAATTEARQPCRTPETPAQPPEKLRILLVDDDPLILMDAAEMLTDLGHQVFEAKSGAEALQLIRDGCDVDLVVTDHGMPQMTGARLAQELQHARPNLAILLATGYADDELSRRLNLPRLDKPYSQFDLAREITRLMRLQRAVQPSPVPPEDVHTG
ncbi:MAG TPA: response regulator [Acetobacteraceae bacterium]|nr:response regulator [Acetobacteraceae bacterium]